jgi:hypothetical protein
LMIDFMKSLTLIEFASSSLSSLDMKRSVTLRLKYSVVELVSPGTFRRPYWWPLPRSVSSQLHWWSVKLSGWDRKLTKEARKYYSRVMVLAHFKHIDGHFPVLGSLISVFYFSIDNSVISLIFWYNAQQSLKQNWIKSATHGSIFSTIPRSLSLYRTTDMTIGFCCHCMFD